MGKRSTFARQPRDLYRTPPEAIPALAPHLPSRFRFAEPCAGDGRLSDFLRPLGGEAMFMGDIAPLRGDVVRQDAFAWAPRRSLDLIVTNPPWRRDLLHGLIERWVWLAPTWLLFDASWWCTLQAAPYWPLLRKVVAVGRLKWIPGSKFTGKDDCAWHLFDLNGAGPCELYGRL